MSNEKRILLAVILMFLWMMALQYIGRLLGFNPPPKPPPAAAAAAEAAKKGEAAKNDEDEKKDEAANKGEAAAAPKEAAKADPAKSQEPGKAQVAAANDATAKVPEVVLEDEEELRLGSEIDTSPDGYRLMARLTQRGAGVETLSSSRIDAEYKDGVAIKRPLHLIEKDRTWPASFTMTLNSAANGEAPAAAAAADGGVVVAKDAEDWLDGVTWEVVRDEKGQIRRRVSMTDPATGTDVEGEAIVFRTKAPNGVVVTKTFRLGKHIDGLEVELRFDSPDKERKVVYNLRGPHGIPIEGEWYTSTFLDLFFGTLDQGRIKRPETYAAIDVAKAVDKPIDNTALPLVYAGVENQYFATLMESFPFPTGQEDRWDSRTVAMAHRKEEALQKSDIGFQITSKPIALVPGQPVTHTYRVFAGPKFTEALRPYKAEELATYRKNQWIPYAPEIARYVIAPTLDMMYRLTESVAQVLGGKKGNYGIAIILLTMLVRGCMFPLGRKQALAAQKMQMLQPHMKAIQEKYKEDKERLTKETFALYKKYGVNPMGGCLPMLVQIPIFVGLWQAINTSVQLRHAKFLWIKDLAAPDMMFRFPWELPFLGHWFNLLPFLVIALMMIQTKLFSPPATTPEAEASQKMMKFMMVFMGVMFYKVPAGLGIYFITSSLWAVGERLLLPKLTHADLTAPLTADEEGDSDGPRGGGNGDGRGPRGGKGPAGGNGVEPKRQGRFAQFFEKLLEEAQKDSTYRKLTEEKESRKGDKDRGDPRARPRRR